MGEHMFNIQPTIAAVQANCDISDARHAREIGLCNYLLSMRGYYRWEKQIPFAQTIKKDDLGAWLSQREITWDTIEENNYRSITVDESEYDFLDTTAINQALKKHGLVYGSGYGLGGRPHFFLAQLLRTELRSGNSLLISGHEYARNITALPAALNSGTIYLRMDAMKRWLWDKVEVWGVSKSNGALKAMLDCYEAENITEAQLDMIAEHESETLILHELGEAMAEPLLGKDWREMLLSFKSRRNELLARAVRDNLADCLSTLPELTARGESCSLHFYFANFEGMHRSLFPSLAEAYDRWQSKGEIEALHKATETGRAHWLRIARHLLAAWKEHPASAEIILGSCNENFCGLML